MISVLFARGDSIYKTFPGVDVWDMERDARKWPGGNPCIAHPPCRAWGCLAHFARPRSDEKELAPWAISKIRENGGVLEHPYTSKIWKLPGMPDLGSRDIYGGWVYPIPQFFFGHRAQKNTAFYIVGLLPHEMPGVPLQMGEPPRVVTNRQIRKKGFPTYRLKAGHPDFKSELSKPERERTPVNCARWLLEICRRIEIKNVKGHKPSFELVGA